MKNNKMIMFVLSLSLVTGIFLSSCAADALTLAQQPIIDLNDIAFATKTTNEGIYPHLDVLDNPDNPFRDSGFIDSTGPWSIVNKGSKAAEYYAWATLLANAGYGEPSLFVADALKAMYPSFSGEARIIVSNMAVRAYASTMLNFRDQSRLWLTSAAQAEDAIDDSLQLKTNNIGAEAYDNCKGLVGEFNYPCSLYIRVGDAGIANSTSAGIKPL